MYTFYEQSSRSVLEVTDRVFPLRFMAQVQGARVINPSDKKRGSVNFSKDQENGISKIFIISLESTKGGRFQRKQTFQTHCPLN